MRMCRLRCRKDGALQILANYLLIGMEKESLFLWLFVVNKKTRFMITMELPE